MREQEEEEEGTPEEEAEVVAGRAAGGTQDPLAEPEEQGDRLGMTRSDHSVADQRDQLIAILPPVHPSS